MTAAWVEGVWEVARTRVTTDLVVVVEVERVACTWVLVVREDVVLVAANNLLVVLVGEDVVTPGEEVGSA